MRRSPAFPVLALAAATCLPGGCVATDGRRPPPPPKTRAEGEVLLGDMAALKRAGRVDLTRAFAAFASDRGALPDLGETDAAYWFLVNDMNAVLGRALRNVAGRHDLDAVVSSEVPVLVGAGEKWVAAEDVTDEVAFELARLAEREETETRR